MSKVDIERVWMALRQRSCQLLNTRIAISIWRVMMLYMALSICRATFYYYNADIIGDIASNEVWMLFKGAMQFDSASICYTMSLFLLMSFVPMSDRVWNKRLYQRILFWLYIIPAAIMLAANMGDAVYFHYTGKRCSAEEIFFAENSNTLGLMFRFMWENWHLVIVYGFIIAALVFGYRRRFTVHDMIQLPNEPLRLREVRNNHNMRRHLGMTVAKYLLQMVVVCLLALYAIGSIRGGYTRMTRPLTLSNAMLYTTDTNKGVMILSNPFCIIRTISNHIEVPRYFDDEEELESIYTPSHYPEDYHSEMFGKCEGCNVVVFILESFSAEHSALLMPELHSGEGYTPNLDHLMRNGLVFSRCYANGMTSIMAPPSVWSSMPSLGHSFLLLSESIADCSSLPRILGNKGYNTAFFNGSESGSMGFGAYAHIAGIEHLYSMENYESRYGNGDFDGQWGIWDEQFIKYMGEELCSFGEPFFASIFTITSHHPFVIPDHAKAELPTGTTKAHQPIAYTDRAIGRFMERFKDEAWFKNTLFIFVADHVSSERVADKSRHTPGVNHIVGFMYHPDGRLRGSYDHVVSQADIMPTALGLMGNNEPYFAMGRDVFNEPQREIFTMINGGIEGTYVALTDQYFIDFNGSITGIFDYADYLRQNNLMDSVDTEYWDRLIKAHLQQYYTHIVNRDYLPAERDEEKGEVVKMIEENTTPIE